MLTLLRHSYEGYGIDPARKTTYDFIENSGATQPRANLASVHFRGNAREPWLNK